MTNQRVILLVQSGVRTSEVVRAIGSARTFSFNLTPYDTDQLLRAGVSEEAIKSMASRVTGQAYPTGNSNPAPDNLRTPHSQPTQWISSGQLRNAVFFPDQGPGGGGVGNDGGPGPRAALVVNESTRVHLRFTQNLSSAHAKIGDPIAFYVLSDVYVKNGEGTFLVIKRGDRARGTITDAYRKRMMGRPGKVEVTLDSVDLANGDKLAITYQKQAEPGNNHVLRMASLMATTVFVVPPATPFWLFLHGADTGIKDGVEFWAETLGVANLDSMDFR